MPFLSYQLISVIPQLSFTYDRSQLTFTSHLFLRFYNVLTVSLSLAEKCRVSSEDFGRIFESLQSLQTRHCFCDDLMTSGVAS